MTKRSATVGVGPTLAACVFGLVVWMTMSDEAHPGLLIASGRIEGGSWGAGMPRMVQGNRGFVAKGWFRSGAFRDPAGEAAQDGPPRCSLY